MSGSLGHPSERGQAVPFVDKPIGREEFCARFVASMTGRANYQTFADGCTVQDYAEETAMSYWELAQFRLLGPEICVVRDMRHWHGKSDRTHG